MRSSFRAMDHLSTMPELVSTLQEISAYDVSALLGHLLPHLVHAAFAPGSGKTPQQDVSVESAVLARLCSALLSFMLHYIIPSLLPTAPPVDGLNAETNFTSSAVVTFRGLYLPCLSYYVHYCTVIILY